MPDAGFRRFSGRTRDAFAQVVEFYAGVGDERMERLMRLEIDRLERLAGLDPQGWVTPEQIEDWHRARGADTCTGGGS